MEEAAAADAVEFPAPDGQNSILQQQLLQTLLLTPIPDIPAILIILETGSDLVMFMLDMAYFGCKVISLQLKWIQRFRNYL